MENTDQLRLGHGLIEADGWTLQTNACGVRSGKAGYHGELNRVSLFALNASGELSLCHGCWRRQGRVGTTWAPGFSRCEAGYVVGSGCTEGHS